MQGRGLPPLDSFKQLSDNYIACWPADDASSMLGDGTTTNAAAKPWGVNSAHYETQVDQVVATLRFGIAKAPEGRPAGELAAGARTGS